MRTRERNTLEQVRKALKTTIATYPYQRCTEPPICKGCKAQERAEKALASLDEMLAMPTTEIEGEAPK